MVAHGTLTGCTLTDSEDLAERATEGFVRVTQALPQLGLTPFQEELVRRALGYELMRLEEGWIDEWIADLAAEVAGSP